MSCQFSSCFFSRLAFLSPPSFGLRRKLRGRVNSQRVSNSYIASLLLLPAFRQPARAPLSLSPLLLLLLLLPPLRLLRLVRFFPIWRLPLRLTHRRLGLGEFVCQSVCVARRAHDSSVEPLRPRARKFVSAEREARQTGEQLLNKV